jgi:hypothetical protein
MHHRSQARNLTRLKCPIPTAVWVNLAVFLQARQPVPAKAANGLEVLQTAVPTIEGDQSWLKATLLSSRKHVTKMHVLGHTIDGLVIEGFHPLATIFIFLE